MRERALVENAAEVASELEFDSELGPPTLRLQTRQALQHEKVLEIVTRLLKEMTIPKELWQLQGREIVTNMFAVQMVGESRGGARRNLALLQQQVQEEASSGQVPAVTARNGAHVPVYFNADKNGRQPKDEAGARRLLRMFRTACPERRLFWSRDSVDGVGVVSEGRRHWHMLAMEAFGLEDAGIAAQWRKQASAQAEDVHWTS